MRLPSEASTPKERAEIVKENFAKVGEWAERAARRQGLIPPTRHNKTPERDIQTEILKWLTEQKIYHYRLNNQATTIWAGGKQIRLPVAQRGLPDIVIVMGGRYIACEVKSAVGTQSEAQKDVQEATERAGGLYWLVRSLGEVQELIKELDK